MKKIIAAIALLFVLLLSGCGDQEPTDTSDLSSGQAIQITLVNEVDAGDVWILPQTEENIKTTLWGTATAAAVATDEQRSVSLTPAGESGLYIFRMIDADDLYYAANGLSLKDGYTIRIGEGSSPMTAIVEVTRADGTMVSTHSITSAKL